MCFNIGFQIKKGKQVRVKENDGDEKESKGLLLKEIERWNKREKEIFNRRDALTPANPSNANH